MSEEIQTTIPTTRIDCIYVISSDTSTEFQQRCLDKVKTKLMPDFDGHLVVTTRLDGSLITKKFLEEHDYELFNWKMLDTTNSRWSKPMSPCDLSRAIAHHRTWRHAHKNEFSGIMVIDGDFDVDAELTSDFLGELPSDWELVYLGREILYEGGDDTPIEASESTVKLAPNSSLRACMLSASGIKSLIDQRFENKIMPIDDFLICCYTKHLRSDLHFIVNDLIVYGLPEEQQIISKAVVRRQSGPRDLVVDNGPIRKHSELYSYWDNPDEWNQRFIAYSARTKEWDLIVDEPFDNCFSMPLFTEEFCVKIREEAEYSEQWTTDRHEFYPTTDMLLEAIAMDRIYYEVLREHVIPAAVHLFGLEGKGWENMVSEDFLAKYVPDAQGHLSLHHDASNITALVTLSSFDEYEGGGTYFSHQKKLVREKQGYVSIHPGNITHKHGARATTKGIRYIIVSFMKNTHFMK